MTGAHVWLAVGLAAVGIGWWLGVEVWRGWSQEHSARVFWLHLTAPLVAIVLLAVAIWLLAADVRVRQQRQRQPASRVTRLLQGELTRHVAHVRRDAVIPSGARNLLVGRKTDSSLRSE